MKLLITGGYPKKDHWKHQYGYRYAEAYIILLDWIDGKILKKSQYKSPPNVRHSEASHQFKAGTLIGDNFLVPCSTEIILWDVKHWMIKKTITHPSFNDLHHVTVKNGTIYIANTGRESVQLINFDGEVIADFLQVKNPTWKKFGESVDLRFVANTKPHQIHLNYVFFLDEEPWFTRFHQRDAVSLFDSRKRIDLDVSQGKPHDGLVRGDFIFFTITDGYIIVVNKNTLRREEIINLNEISNKGCQLGWCRGLEIVDNQAFVGFSSLRRSKFREYGEWIVLHKKRLPARITEYDLIKRELVREFEISERGASIFCIRRFKNQ